MNAPSSPEAAALPELPAALPLPSAQSSIVAKANAIAELAGAATPLIGMALRSTSNGKPGWQTTEFWLTAVALGLNILGATSGVLKPETAAMIGSLLTVAYSVLRTIIKTANLSPADPLSISPASPQTENRSAVNNAAATLSQA